jgi:methionyl-tRNA formyltransferase
MYYYWTFYGNPRSVRASRIALKALHDMQCPALTKWSDRAEVEFVNINALLLASDEHLFLKNAALLCVHGRRILPKRVLDSFRYGCINVHPYLRDYPGADPIGRAIADGNTHASVASHWMSENVDDSSRIIVEHTLELRPGDLTTREDVYKQLYGLYRSVVRETIKQVNEQIAVLDALQD